MQICIFYFGISKFINFTRELLPGVQVNQISETMRCLYPITRETSEMDSKGTSLKMVSAKGTETSDNKKKTIKKQTNSKPIKNTPGFKPFDKLFNVIQKRPS